MLLVVKFIKFILIIKRVLGGSYPIFKKGVNRGYGGEEVIPLVLIPLLVHPWQEEVWHWH